MKYVACNKCGRVHVALGLKKVHRYIVVGGADPGKYMDCSGCGGSYLDFRDSKPGDCPDYSTITAILDLDYNETSGLGSENE